MAAAVRLLSFQSDAPTLQPLGLELCKRACSPIFTCAVTSEDSAGSGLVAGAAARILGSPHVAFAGGTGSQTMAGIDVAMAAMARCSHLIFDCFRMSDNPCEKACEVVDALGYILSAGGMMVHVVHGLVHNQHMPRLTGILRAAQRLRCSGLDSESFPKLPRLLILSMGEPAEHLHLVELLQSLDVMTGSALRVAFRGVQVLRAPAHSALDFEAALQGVCEELRRSAPPTELCGQQLKGDQLRDLVEECFSQLTKQASTALHVANLREAVLGRSHLKSLIDELDKSLQQEFQQGRDARCQLLAEFDAATAMMQHQALRGLYREELRRRFESRIEHFSSTQLCRLTGEWSQEVQAWRKNTFIHIAEREPEEQDGQIRGRSSRTYSPARECEKQKSCLACEALTGRRVRATLCDHAKKGRCNMARSNNCKFCHCGIESPYSEDKSPSSNRHQKPKPKPAERLQAFQDRMLTDSISGPRSALLAAGGWRQNFLRWLSVNPWRDVHEEAPSLILDAVGEYSGWGRRFCAEFLLCAVDVCKPAFPDQEVHHWQALHDGLLRARDAPTPQPSIVDHGSGSSEGAGGDTGEDAEDRELAGRLGIVKDLREEFRSRRDLFPNLSHHNGPFKHLRPWPSFLGDFSYTWDNMCWRLGLRQLETQWAVNPDLPQDDYPVRGFMEKYNLWLIEMANSKLQGMRGGVSQSSSSGRA